MNIKLIILSFAILFFASCSKNNSFQISGNFKNVNNQLIYISEITGNGILLVDSIKINERGDFSYEKESNELLFLFLKVGNKPNNFITLIINPNEKIKLAADGNQLAKTYSVIGSNDSKLAYDLNNKTIESSAKIDSLTAIYNENKDKPNFDSIEININKSNEGIMLNHRKFVIDFIEKNPSSPASILALYQKVNKTKILDPSTDIKYFKKVSEALTKKYPDSKHSKLLNHNVSEMEKSLSGKRFDNLNITVGEMAPDISLPTPEGTKLSLSSLKGKVVLLDFWASWCRPCRNENPNLVENYKKYQSKGFEILQVSLDKTHENWLEAIKKDNLSWKHISDLMFWQSEAAKLYKIESIPSNFLIDKDGKIIAKDLHEEDLGKKLEEIFKK